MKKVIYVTGNQHKLKNAKAFLASYDIEPESKKLSLKEIQSDDAVAIALQKARDAYAEIHEPLFINDASWHIPALNGFPGPYMHSMLDWLTTDDFLRLMEDKDDRTIILRDTIAYKDGNTEKVFTNDVYGNILKTPQGEGEGPYITKIISLSASGKSIAEANITGFSKQESVLWRNFAEWLRMQ